MTGANANANFPHRRGPGHRSALGSQSYTWNPETDQLRHPQASPLGPPCTAGLPFPDPKSEAPPPLRPAHADTPRPQQVPLHPQSESKKAAPISWPVLRCYRSFRSLPPPLLLKALLNAFPRKNEILPPQGSRLPPASPPRPWKATVPVPTLPPPTDVL